MSIFPDTGTLLHSGGDARIVPDPQTGRNKYGCTSSPSSDLHAFGSSTASTISSAGMAAAMALRERCAEQVAVSDEATVYRREVRRLRAELLSLCGLSDYEGVATLIAASGTDIHLLLAQALQPQLTVMIDLAETGSGLAAALQGQHFSADGNCAAGMASGRAVSAWQGSLLTVAARDSGGNPRTIAEVDAELERILSSAVAAGQRVLLILTDVCKTGMIFPAIASVRHFQQTWPQHIQVLVDACQFRLSRASLRAYLELNFCVALTGSKFLAGPTFSGALLIPPGQAASFRSLPLGARAYSWAADWPADWPAASSLAQGSNFGLLLRWEAALAELRRFAALDEAAIIPFLRRFQAAVSSRLAQDPHFEALTNPSLDRQALTTARSWDQEPSIFPFLLYAVANDGQRRPLARHETAVLYRRLQGMEGVEGIAQHTSAADCYTLGQPVLCGQRDGVPVSALRLCVSAAMLVAAQDPLPAEALIATALAALDRLVSLIDASSRSGRGADQTATVSHAA